MPHRFPYLLYLSVHIAQTASSDQHIGSYRIQVGLIQMPRQT
nr:MAG TPA: hypothetical protein [Caudoviricetes sp.]